MKRLLLFFGVILLALGFALKKSTESLTPTHVKESTPPLMSALVSEPVPYSDFLKSTNRQRKIFADDLAARAALFRWIHEDMPNYWDDTGWDFYGMSRIPGQGEIACGYFVTTLLKDLGFEIDRIRLAKARSGVMIEELTNNIKKTRSFDTMLEYVQSQPEGSVFIIGLDFHTGFITSAPDGIFFIHSNYIGREGVVKEHAISSEALHDSGFYMIGNLSTRKDVMEVWQNG